MIKKSEIKNLDKTNLEKNLVELRKELIRVNAQVSTGTTPENPGNIKQLKKNIARILTYIRQKKVTKEKSEEKVKPKLEEIKKKAKEEKAKDNE